MVLMNRKHQGSVISSTILVFLLILCAFVINTYAFTVVEGEEKEREEVVPISKPSSWEVLKNGFSVYSSSPLKVTSYWENFKLLMHQLHAYFIPPNLDFRGSGNARSTIEEPSNHGGGGGAGEAVKVAVSKSFGIGKEAVEDTAKSAARVVGETVQKTKERVKRSFSDQGGHQPHEPEL